MEERDSLAVSLTVSLAVSLAVSLTLSLTSTEGSGEGRHALPASFEFETNRTICRQDLKRRRIDLVVGRLGGGGLRVLLVPAHESGAECGEVHLELLLVRVVSVHPVLLGDESVDAELILEEDVGGSVTLLRSVEREDVVGEDTDRGDQGAHGETVLPVVVVEVVVNGEAVGSDLRSVPSIEIRAHSVKVIMRGGERTSMEERDSLAVSLAVSLTLSLDSTEGSREGRHTA